MAGEQTDEKQDAVQKLTGGNRIPARAGERDRQGLHGADRARRQPRDGASAIHRAAANGDGALDRDRRERAFEGVEGVRAGVRDAPRERELRPGARDK